MPNHEKTHTDIPQNFEIVKGQIVVDGKTLPPKSGVTPIPKDEKKSLPRSNKQMRFKDGSYLTQQQVIDENYQIRNKIS